jgi:hypothetical protein
MRLSRERLAEAVETMPLDSILGQGASKGLTGKQRRFAREVAQGSTKADAYRKAYKPTATRATLTGEPYRVASHPSVAAEIQALQLAEQAQALQTPAQLRALVIQTLVKTALDPETKAAVRVQAVKVLGSVVEVGAFVHRTEVKHISSSEDARAKVMAEIRALMLGTGDAEDIEAKTLLDELSATDTDGEYDDAQPVDSYEDDQGQEPQDATKDGFLSPNMGEIVGGVSTPPTPDPLSLA